ncbi:hypothetical protein AWQ21_10220 [Picosynechococcus sp. PCC 7003]|uniref:hypothetical protein n=1 Tax=Picosynechococcus sp. PCC 7003 TaxID=374981 RepID=UPI000810991B|nr:hypothetical protein [Picosynechococcus sp. PCC 7003]ANV84722.1 hypothetical protein AWQ21_10220 [Picosynechococcus sp. PCC 7003]
MWLNFLALLPSTTLTVLLIAIAFLRFYDQTDFEFLGYIANPRQWSNGFTVAALLATLANFGVEWNRRNRETNRLVEEAQRRAKEEQRRIREEQRRVAQERADESRRTEERERQIARTRIETRCRIAEIQFQLDPSERNRRALKAALAVLAEYGELFP